METSELIDRSGDLSDTPGTLCKTVSASVRASLELLAEAIIIVDCDDGQIRFANQAAHYFFKYDDQCLQGQHHRSLYPAAGGQGYRADDLRMFDGAITMELLLGDKTLQPFDAMFRPAVIDGDDCLIGSYRPALERSVHDQALIEAAEFDALTGALNKASFVSRLQQEIDRCRRYGSPMSLAMCDLDEFKEINDTHGHLAGDMALKATVDGIRRQLRSTDIVGRFGGDEFLICLPGAGAVGARLAIRRIVQATRDVVVPEFANSLHSLSISAGVCDWHTEVATAADLIDRADGAVYKAKRLGRDRMAVWSPGDQSQWKHVA